MTEKSYLTIPDLDHAGKILHTFTTRTNDLGKRNNGIKMPGDWDVVAGLFGISPDRLVTVNQVHSENIVRVDSGNYHGVRTLQADALITNEPGFAIGVETADCVPVLLLDPAVPAIGAVHAGWRGTVKKIVQRSVMKMQEAFGSDPSRVLAGIGPAIGPECYEVDEPVMGPIRETFPFWKEVTTPRGNDRWGLDLVKVNTIELMQAGLQEKNIHSLGMCTSCRKDLFYSFRSEGMTGRMLSVIMIKPYT
jgi:YfiH family protein